jgi:hypothetical protein
MKNRLEYKRVEPDTEARIRERIQSNNPEDVAEALYSAVRHVENREFVQNACLERLESPEIKIRWAAATCLGDLVYFGGLFDVDKVILALELAARDPSIAGPASLSLSMVKQAGGVP